MEKLKEYKYIIFIILIVLGLAFYWFEWRSSQIRKQCFRDILKNDSIEIIGSSGIFGNQFEACLFKYGIER